MVFCTNCGVENTDNNKFCTNCGNLLNKSNVTKKDINELFDFKIEFTNEAPESVVEELEENIKNGCIEYCIDLKPADRIKAGNIIAEGIRNQEMHNETINRLEKELNISRDMAESIEQTEKMRSAHTSSYRQALNDEKLFYIIDNKFDSCETCRKIAEGKIYSINNKKNIPPLHNKCSCIPVYFFEREDAEEWVESLKNEHMDARENLTNMDSQKNGYDFISRAEYKINNIDSSNCDITDYEEVLNLFNKSLNMNISELTKAKIYRSIGEIYYNLGDYKEALNNFEKALELNPKIGVKRLYEKLKKF